LRGRNDEGVLSAAAMAAATAAAITWGDGSTGCSTALGEWEEGFGCCMGA
jgi:hypothetical protein